MASLTISWEQYNVLVERLALIVHESGYAFDQIICIARGGMRVGDVLSRIFDTPLAILFDALVRGGRLARSAASS
jgi:hypoxanthine phosphoribosyltransferase